MTEAARPAMRVVWLWLGAVAIAALLVSGFLEGRREGATERERERPVKAPSRVSVEAGEVVVTIDPQTLARSGIEVAALRATTRRRSIPAYGTVLGVGTLAAAQTSYASARAEAEKARVSLEASRREFERVKALHKAGQNLSTKALEAAEAAFRADEASFGSAEADLAARVATLEQDWGSTIATWLLRGSPSLKALLARQDVLIQITLPPDQTVARAPETVLVHGGAGAAVEARFASAASRTDPRVQGLTFYYLAPAAIQLLPGMSAVADLPIGEEITGLIVPRPAVVWFQGSAWVYLQTAQAQFSRRMIATDTRADGGFLVRDLPRGASAVVGGAELLLSEEARAQIQVGEESER